MRRFRCATTDRLGRGRNGRRGLRRGIVQRTLPAVRRSSRADVAHGVRSCLLHRVCGRSALNESPPAPALLSLSDEAAAAGVRASTLLRGDPGLGHLDRLMPDTPLRITPSTDRSTDDATGSPITEIMAVATYVEPRAELGWSRR